MHFALLLILLIVILGMLPQWPHSAQWGYGPSGIGALVLLLLFIWLFFGGGARHF